MARHRAARNTAFRRQAGLCYYCLRPMWLTGAAAFAARYGLSLRQAAHYQCTGEHLTPRHAGGGGGANIAAACRRCNLGRHKHRPVDPPAPDAYLARVRKRVALGRWHPALLGMGKPTPEGRPCGG